MSRVLSGSEGWRSTLRMIRLIWPRLLQSLGGRNGKVPAEFAPLAAADVPLMRIWPQAHSL